MYTSLGDPPWLVVGAPMPTPAVTVTASTAPIAVPIAAEIHPLWPAIPLIDLTLSPGSVSVDERFSP
jgi:hypothetical protein